MVCKACIVGTYQRKLEEIAAHSDVELVVLVPPHWRERHNIRHLERVHTEGYVLKVVPVRFSGNYHLHYYPTLSKELRELKPDILHMDEEPYNLATWLAIRHAFKQRVLSLFFTWQNIYRRYPPPFAAFERFVYNHANFAIAGNEEALEVLRRKGFRGPGRVIPQFGVDPEVFAPAAQAADRPFTIGFAGRLVPEKGVDILLHAVAKLGGDWRLHIVGDGPARPQLKQMAHRLNIQARVRWSPSIPSAEMPEFYRGLDVLVLPSRTRPNWKEQFGRVLIEAMACEVPVIGSTCGEIPNVIGEAGLTFPEEDADALAAHLRALQEDRALRRSLGKQGRERVLAHFTHRHIAEETVHVYRHLVYDIGIPPVVSR